MRSLLPFARECREKGGRIIKAAHIAQQVYCCSFKGVFNNMFAFVFVALGFMETYSKKGGKSDPYKQYATK